MMTQLSGRDRRWLSALLVLGTLTVAMLLLSLVVGVLTYFSDIILVFFLAWLLAFILSPVPDAAHRWAPRLPRLVVVVITYLALLLGLFLLTVVTAQVLASSITSFVESLPELIENLPALLAPWQGFLDQFGLRVDLEASAQAILAAAGNLGGTIVEPLTDIAIASIGVLGNLILILVFSLYIVVDRDRMLDFFQRLVPGRYIEEFRLLRVSVARSFGGFLRGQAALGAIYFFVALGCQLVLGLQYTAASAVLSGALMAIPFFGPFVAWMPPVIVAALTASDQVVPAILIMGIGVLAELNIVQPRVMAGTVGISPLVVLASVVIGLKVAGIAGAVFSVPIAAVLSSFFFFYLDRYRPKPIPDTASEPGAGPVTEATAPPGESVAPAE
ncbi:MAG: AI-2E family transporter [Candidatus Limnocylindrales bacterium]